MVSEEGEVIIADFGLSRIISQPLREYTNEVTTLNYRAPELIVGEKKYCIGVDIWSLGCLLSEIVTGEVLFTGTSELELLFQMCRILGTPSPEAFPAFMLYIQGTPNAMHLPKNLQGPKLEERLGDLSQLGKDLISSMLSFDPNKRITCREALKHPFLST